MSRRQVSDPAVGVSTVVQRATELRNVYGNNVLARMLRVNQAQPTRWSQRRETPNAESARRILDLEYVTSRFLQVWPSELLNDWLEGPNEFLNGARPVDVLELEGPLPLIGAIDAGEEGAFA